MSKVKKDNNYFDNKKFIKSLIIYYDTNNIKALNELCSSLIQLANNIASRYNFNNYTYKDEMVGDAILIATKALLSKKIKVSEPSNPYGYLTKIMIRSFKHRLNQEALIESTRKKYLFNYQLVNDEFSQNDVIEEAKLENDNYILNDLWKEEDKQEEIKKTRKNHYLAIERKYNKPVVIIPKDKTNKEQYNYKVFYDLYDFGII
jgi:hypothetical protein